MKTSDIRLMGLEEIAGKLAEARTEFMNQRFQIVSGQLQDTSKLKQARRLIARYETIIREKELAENVKGEA